ncbi:MAG: hypothetical protein WBW53_09415 [Terriglobales bacterium]
MNFKGLAGVMFVLAVVLIAAAPYASAAAPATGYYQVGLTENCNAWYFWTQNAPVAGDWQYASGYQDGCVTGFVDAGFQVVFKKGQPPNNSSGTNRGNTDIELSDLYWCNYISDCSDMFVSVFDIGTGATVKHPNSMVYYYVDGDTYLYEYDQQPITVDYEGVAKAKPEADASNAHLPPVGSSTPANAGAKGKDGIRVQ